MRRNIFSAIILAMVVTIAIPALAQTGQAPQFFSNGVPADAMASMMAQLLS